MRSDTKETTKSLLLFYFNPLFVLIYICLGIAFFVVVDVRRDRAAYDANVEATAGDVSGVIQKIEVSSREGLAPEVKAFIKRADGTYVRTRIQGETAKAVLARFDEGRGLNVKVTVDGNGVVKSMDFKQG